MCGVVGFVKHGNDEVLRKKLSQSLATLKHRGPDKQKTYVNRPVYLGHTRLHIMNSIENSDQPFVSPDGKYVITYNGEVYNYLTIKQTLEAKGFVFKTETDTEVVLYAYQHWGKDCVRHFSGMFAFCIHDTGENLLFLARDIFGEKPLYYSLDGGFSFCSELRAFQIINDGAKTSIEALNHFLAIGYVLNPITPLEGVHLLPPATAIVYSIDTGRVNKFQYFDYASCFEQKTTCSVKDASEQVLDLLSKSVSSMVSGPFPFGMFLSGGLDSSSVAALLKSNGHTFPCYNASFVGSVYDEADKADFASRELGLKLKKLSLTHVNPSELHDYFDTIDHCTFDNSGYAMYRLAELAKNDVQYVLSGDGADECFGGYTTYKADRIRERLKLIIPVLNLLGNSGIAEVLFKRKNDKVGFNTKVSRFLNGLNRDFRRSHYNWRSLFGPEERIGILGFEHAELILDTDPFHDFAKHYNRVSHLSATDQHLFVDSQTWLTDNVLIKTDRNTMLFGLEARSPFLDKDLVSFVASCPEPLKKDKVLLKNAMRNILSEHIIHQKKEGFNAPIVSWLGTDTERDEFKYYTRFLFNHKYSLS